MEGTPQRNDDVANWLIRERNRFLKGEQSWMTIDTLLDDYRLHADTGTKLFQYVVEGGKE